MKVNIIFGPREYGKTYRLIERYIKASKYFNKIYENKYKINVFIDFEFLNIYFYNLKNNRIYNYQILNNCINDLSVKEIIKAYEELIY